MTETDQQRLAAMRGNLRYARPLIFLFVCGIGFLVGGASTWNGDPSATTPGWLNQNFGPHGSAVVLMLLGIGMLIGGCLLGRKVYRARKVFDAQQAR